MRAGGERVSGPLFMALDGSGLVTHRQAYSFTTTFITSAG